MNRGGLKSASRQCIRDAHCNVRRLTLLFLLCLYAVCTPIQLFSYFLSENVHAVTGIGALAARNRNSLAVILIGLGLNGLGLLWGAGYTAFTLQLSRGGQAGFSDFFAGFLQIGRVLMLQILIIVRIWLWSLLFIIPGIFAAYSYRMALYVLLDNPEVTASEALAISKRLTYGHRGELFVLDLSFFWYYFFGTVATFVITYFAADLLPVGGWMGYLITYGISMALVLVMDTLFRGYIQTTDAHAYNWMLSLDKARREDENY